MHSNEIPKAYLVENSKRQTGRTTRMLKKALEADQAGKAVYVLCLKEAIPYTKNLLLKVVKDDSLSKGDSLGHKLFNNIKIESLVSIGERNIDWKNKSIYGAHSNCQLFIDHAVYSQMFSHVMNGYCEYDL